MLPLLFATGTLVLIWLIQLVVYPSFSYYSPKNLKVWHPFYTSRVSYVVLPLMFGQLICSAYEVFAAFDLFSIVRLCLVLSTWVSTFVIFVPLHQAIEKTSDTTIIIKKLITKNWIRTFLWSLLFVLEILVEFTSIF